LVIQESRSAEARRLIKGTTVAASWLARLEVASALTRLWRERKSDEAGLASDLSELDRLASCWVEVPLREDLRQQAMRLLRAHALRSLDALQLASAWFAAEGRPETLDFICFDTRLAAAARHEGFRVTS
jgi:predicted nucleic acid-binding protein